MTRSLTMQTTAAPRPNAPPTAIDDPSHYLVAPATLPHQVQRAMIERTLRDAAQRGLRRVGVFPAGRHTARLSGQIFTDCGVELVAVLDDSRHGQMLGLNIQTTRNATDLDAILISSDSAEASLASQAQSWAGDATILRVYVPLMRQDVATKSARRNAALARLAEECNGRINLGCGSHPLPGWTNIDGGDGQWFDAPQDAAVIPLDVFDALAAIPDASCDYVCSEHFYEHFTLDDGFRMACEWARILKPGGVVRLATPDLAQEARIYLGQQLPADRETFLRHKRRWLGDRHASESRRFLTPAMLFNFGARLDGHQFIYDFETLQQQLQAAGFRSITREKFGRSRHTPLNGIDHHNGGETGGTWLQDVQLIVEAIRP
jgi:predicted SAM-dependent methyltransferase